MAERTGAGCHRPENAGSSPAESIRRIKVANYQNGAWAGLSYQKKPSKLKNFYPPLPPHLYLNLFISQCFYRVFVRRFIGRIEPEYKPDQRRNGDAD
jgi:hypothetical protein